jgi:hypothetical protein
MMEEELGLLSVGDASIAEVGRGYGAPVDLIEVTDVRPDSPGPLRCE